MLLRRVIPCLDVAGGRVVKGTRFIDLVEDGHGPGDVDQGSVLRYDEADLGYARGGESEFRFFLGGCQPCHEQRKQTDQNGPQERG